jgi:NAD(P)-dependent dehydrogenase (short-subunit alcohol dehydrogenase family)
VSNDRHPDSVGAAVYHVSKISIRAFTIEVAAEERDNHICIVSMGPGSGGNHADGRRGIATDETTADYRERMNWVGDVVQDRYLLAAEAPMELSGKQITVKHGQLVPLDD